jgi:hypothetical protein
LATYGSEAALPQALMKTTGAPASGAWLKSKARTMSGTALVEPKRSTGLLPSPLSQWQ